MGESVGWFNEGAASKVSWVTKVFANLKFLLDFLKRLWLIPWEVSIFRVMKLSRMLQLDFGEEILRNRNSQFREISGNLYRVRVVTIAKDPKKIKFHFFFERTYFLDWDPCRFVWKNGVKSTPLLEYSPRLERILLKKWHVIPNLVTRKWQGILHQDFCLRWSTVWDKVCSRKEAGLLWLI